MLVLHRRPRRMRLAPRLACALFRDAPADPREQRRGILAVEEPLVLAAHDPVALAALPFEVPALEDVDLAAVRRDQTVRAQLREDLRDAGAPHAEHLREELVRERESGRAQPVAGGEQPARATLADGMEAVAGRRLREQREGRLRIPVHRRAELGALFEVPAKRPRWHAEAVAGNLHHRLADGAISAERDREADEPFASDRRDLYGGAVRHRGEHGDDAAL